MAICQKTKKEFIKFSSGLSPPVINLTYKINLTWKIWTISLGGGGGRSENPPEMSKFQKSYQKEKGFDTKFTFLQIFKYKNAFWGLYFTKVSVIKRISHLS